MYRESLQNNREQILLSKKLATIDTTVPVEFEMANLAAQEPDIAELKKIYKELEFYSLLKEVGPTEDSHTRDYASIATRERKRLQYAREPGETRSARSRLRLRSNPPWKAICR